MIPLCIRENYEMYKNIATITALCLLLCISINFTFPMHKNSELENESSQTNDSPPSKRVYANKIAQSTRKMAKRIGNAYKKFKDSNCSKPAISSANDDLKQYEQMVIMKKYPYLDLKDFESKYGAGAAGERGKDDERLTALDGAGDEPGICEALDDVLNVEIVNRGLSGFAIPPPEVNAIKLKVEMPKESRRCNDGRTALNSLKDDILKYEEDLDYRT